MVSNCDKECYFSGRKLVVGAFFAPITAGALVSAAILFLIGVIWDFVNKGVNS